MAGNSLCKQVRLEMDNQAAKLNVTQNSCLSPSLIQGVDGDLRVLENILDGVCLAFVFCFSCICRHVSCVSGCNTRPEAEV